MAQENLETSATDGGVTPHCERQGWFSWMKWKPTGPEVLIKAEQKMLSVLKRGFTQKYVSISNGNKLWTLIINKEIEHKTPLVMVHGFAGGIGLWALNLDALSENRPLYAFDLLGFGRSSHPHFAKDSVEVENQFMESLEEWRSEMGIEKMILLGHSFGGFLVSSYALKYPERIKHLILADPWGFPEWKENPERGRSFPLWAKVLVRILSPFNPLAIVRVSGPFGPTLLRRFRADLGAKFDHPENESTTSPVFDYIYHCNAQNPSGETGFKNLTTKIGFAANPMINRIGGLTPALPVSFIYGARTWMDMSCGRETQSLLTENPVDIYSVKEAGHHVYADQPEYFHKIVRSICEHVD